MRKLGIDFKLNSVVEHGVGSSHESIMMDIIYGKLLAENGQTVYNRITINQVGEDLDEFVVKDPGNKVHCNIRYPVDVRFEEKPLLERNKMRLAVIHEGLLRIADYDKKFDKEKLEIIKNQILEKNFEFEFLLKTHINKKNKSIIARITVHPQINFFSYHVTIEKAEAVICKIQFYKAQPVAIYSYNSFFKNGNWDGENTFILTGDDKEVITKIIINTSTLEIINLTPYTNPPNYTLMRADISKEIKNKAHEDWIHSLPPSTAAILRKAFN